MRLRWVSLFSLLSIALAGCGSSPGKAADIPNLSPSNPKEVESRPTPLPFRLSSVSMRLLGVIIKRQLKKSWQVFFDLSFEF